MNAAGKTYLIRFGTAMAVYVVLLIAVLLIVKPMQGSDPNPLKYALMILPVIPVAFGLLAFIRFFESMDELQKSIQLYALAFSFAVSGLLSFAYGMLEIAGLPRLSWIWIFPLMIGIWGIGTGIASRRYQ